MTCFMGIDLGGTIVKASIFDAAGRELGTAGRRTRLITDEPGQAERSISETRELTFAAIRDALETAGISPGDIAGISTTGHGKGLYTLRRDGSPGEGIVSMDTRSWEFGESFMNAPDFDEAIYSRTFQPFWPGHTAPILVWLKHTHPGRYTDIGHIMLAKDLLRYFLTDEVHVEKTDISGTGFWNNLESRVDETILERLGIPEIGKVIPDVLESHDPAGTVTRDAAAATGLVEGTPVLGGLFDVNACVLATGVEKPDEIEATVGTWGISAFVAEDVQRAIRAPERYVIQEHCVPGQRLVHEASPTSASNLEWFTATMLPELPESDRFAYCNRAAAETTETSVSFFPYLFGDDLGADASGTFMGIRAGTTREEIIRAVYEGVVFQHARHMNKLLAVAEPPKHMRFAGGATRSAVWMQMYADTLGVPLLISAATELGALGAAICAAVGVGAYDGYPAAMKAMTSIRETFEPDAERGEKLRVKQARFAELVTRLDPVWRFHA
jgi:L-xylulokinase